MKKRLLVIEDDQELGSQIVKSLQTAGFDSTWWKEGKTIDKTALADVELVVLDLMLPGTYGLDILKSLRSRSDVPVLVLSALNDTASKVRALQLGADDYMTKPFWPEELVERVRARLRRPSMQRNEALEVGPLRVDREAREASLAGARIELTRVEFDFLVALAERPGAAITRKHLADRILDPSREGSERTLDVHASRLRKKLGTSVVIETVWGIGYRLLAEPAP